MSFFHSFLGFCAMVLAVIGIQVGLALANLPTVFSNVKSVTDVPFGSEPWQMLDVYVPPHKAGEKLSVVVFFYGGKWTYGKRSQYPFVGNALANKNFIVVIPDYRKYPDVKFPSFVEDGAKAVAWAITNIGDYDGDATKLHIAGHSAGAHIAALLLSDRHYLKTLGVDSDKAVRSFAGLAGPYAFTPDEPDLKDMFGPPENYPNMQVPTFINGKEPPMLLAWGEDDTDVGRFNLEKLATRIDEKKGRVETEFYPNTNHIDIIAGLTWLNPSHISVLDDMTAFFRANEK